MIVRILRITFFGLVFIAAMGFLTTALWNWLIPTLFNGPKIIFAQALGLMILGRLLVGGWGKGSSSSCSPDDNAWKAKWKARVTGMTEDEKDAFKKRFCDRGD
jgi:hypothetical protein